MAGFSSPCLSKFGSLAMRLASSRVSALAIWASFACAPSVAQRRGSRLSESSKIRKQNAFGSASKRPCRVLSHFAHSSRVQSSDGVCDDPAHSVCLVRPRSHPPGRYQSLRRPPFEADQQHVLCPKRQLPNAPHYSASHLACFSSSGSLADRYASSPIRTHILVIPLHACRLAVLPSEWLGSGP